MKIAKYLFFCLMDCLSQNVAFTKDAIVGIIQIIVFFAVLVFAEYLTTWYYGVLITLGVIAALYGVISIVEITVRLIIKLLRKNSDNKKDG